LSEQRPVRGRLEDKVAIVTGAATGIGRAFATVFAEEGADVVIVDINQAEAAITAEQVRAHGREALVQICDVTQPDQVQAMVDATVARFGRIDTLVNGAIMRAGGPIEDLPLEAWDRLMNIGLRGYFIVGQAVGRQMISQKSGVLINLASTGGYHAYPGSGAYSSCKAAVIMLAKQWAIEWGQYGIRAVSISPGYVRTPMTDHLYAQPEVPKRSPARARSWRPMTPATSPAPTCSWRAGSWPASSWACPAGTSPSKHPPRREPGG
jgi:NAD(P)-dependent dehydrogenase (short-subunit alcohol dehydrogenase family)